MVSLRTGMQGYPLSMSEDRGIPVTEILLPEYFKEAGYATHLVGKWHVGASRNEFLPTARGFDSHFGHRGGYLDYYEYTLDETVTLHLEFWYIIILLSFVTYYNFLIYICSLVLWAQLLVSRCSKI